MLLKRSSFESPSWSKGDMGRKGSRGSGYRASKSGRDRIEGKKRQGHFQDTPLGGERVRVGGTTRDNGLRDKSPLGLKKRQNPEGKPIWGSKITLGHWGSAFAQGVA